MSATGTGRDTHFAPDVTRDRVEVWLDDEDRLWRWRFVGHDGTTLMANRSSPTRDEAMAAARVAYPGVPVREQATPPSPSRRRRRGRAWLVGLLVAASVLTAGLVLVVLAAVAVAAVAAKRVRSRLGGMRRG